MGKIKKLKIKKSDYFLGLKPIAKYSMHLKDSVFATTEYWEQRAKSLLENNKKSS